MPQDKPSAASRDPALAPTLETVADMAGVSRATVSRVVNGDQRVAAVLRLEVEKAIKALNFVPNRAARSLATRRSDSVALIMREPADFGVTDPYLSRMVIALSHALSEHGLQLVVLMAAGGEADARVAEYARGHVDGVLLISVHDADLLPGQLDAAGVPLVTGGRISQRLERGASVDVDNIRGGALAAERLLGTGRSRIGVITGPVDTCASNDRLTGFRSVLEEAGRPTDLVGRGDWTSTSGERAMVDLLARDPSIDGVFACSDLMAIGALHAVRVAGRRTPDDVAVIGFDDIDMAAHTSPPLTTVAQPSSEQARRMVDLLVAKLAGRAVEREVVLPVDLVVRESA